MTLNGCICCHSGCDFGRIAILCFTQGDCLCLRHSCCLDPKIESRGVGLVTKPEHGECCKLGFYCCDCGLVNPQVLCAESSQFLCCYSVESFPLNKEHQNNPVCSMFCLQCLPHCGCCASPGECKTLDHVFEKRNLAIYTGTMPDEDDFNPPAQAMERE